jgi:glycosyltransferase involved in cell wall biosynthesis
VAKLRIAYILTPVEFGGAEKVCLTFLKNVDRDKFDIAPILLTRPWERENEFRQKIKKENYTIHEVPVAKSATEGYHRIVRCYRLIYSILRERSVDLIHTNGYFADIIGMPLAQMFRIPAISTCHGFISNNWKYRLYNKLDLVALKFFNKIIAVSATIKDDLIRSGISESRILVIPNAVEYNYREEVSVKTRQYQRRYLNIKENDFVIGYVGRLSEEKGIKYLIEASLLLSKSGVPLKVLIIGEGSQRKELEDFVNETGLNHQIIFTGFQADIEKWLPALDVFVLPSLTEGTPMALLEAMSFGIPIIASRVGGVPNIVINGQNGILVEAGHSEEIAHSLNLLFQDISLRQKISLEALNLISTKHNSNSWCMTIQDQYAKLIERNEQETKNTISF